VRRLRDQAREELIVHGGPDERALEDGSPAELGFPILRNPCKWTTRRIIHTMNTYKCFAYASFPSLFLALGGNHAFIPA